MNPLGVSRLVAIGLAVMMLVLAHVAVRTQNHKQSAAPHSKELPSLRGSLRSLIHAVTAEDGEPTTTFALAHGGRIPVTVRCTNTAEVLRVLDGMMVRPANVRLDVIEVYLTPREILSVANHSHVLSIEPIDSGRENIISQGREVHNATPWIAEGYTAAGVKVGIIDSFVGIQALQGSELPTTIIGRCYTEVGLYTPDLTECERTTDHGTALAESLIDIAPDVTLYIANPVSKIDLISTVNWMTSQGVKVINYSISHVWDGPGDGTSPDASSPLAAVDAAVAGGAVFVTAAGNDAGGSSYYNSWRDADADGTYDFSPWGGESNEIFLQPGERMTVQLRWDDSWTAASRDVDLLVYNGDGTLVHSSENPQSGLPGQTPFEYLTYVAPTLPSRFFIVVQLRAGTAPSWLQFQERSYKHFATGSAQFSTGNPAETANRGALTVGAAPWSATSTLERFSSMGPTPDLRFKPELVGADRADTVTLGPGAFQGTSQAAAHVAGLAALVAGTFPAYTPEQIATYLKVFALPRGVSVPNQGWGHGFAHLPDLCAISVAPKTIRVTSRGGTFPIAISAPSGCAWSATSLAFWALVDQATGTGGGTVTLTVHPSPSPGLQRSATVGIAGAIVTIEQAAFGVPVISDIEDLTGTEDTPAAIAFTIDDRNTQLSALGISGTSSNPSLVNTAGLVFGGTAGSRTVTVTPLSNQFGSTTIAITVTNGTASATDTFNLTITPVNDAPAMSTIASQDVVAGTLVGPLAITVADIDSDVGALTLSASTDNAVVVPASGLVVEGTTAFRTLSAQTNATGLAVITVIVTDGELSASTSFQIRSTHSSPSALSATTDGSIVSFSWAAPLSGGPASGYRIELGRSSGTTATTLETSATTLSTTMLATGSWFARVRAVGSVGQGSASNEVLFTLSGAPSRPLDFAVLVVGNQVSLTWTQPLAGVVSRYRLEAGTAAGLANLAILDVGTSLSFVAQPPNGQYFVRVKAINAVATSAPSNEVAFSVPVVPSAPGNLHVRVSGASVLVSWDAPDGATAATAYRIDVGSAAGLSDLASVPVVETSVSADGVPMGTYFIRVRAVNPAGAGPASAEAQFTVVEGAALAPGTPTDLRAVIMGSGVTVTWSPSTSGGVTTNYMLHAGSAQGLSDIAVLPLGASSTFSTWGVPSGTYFVRILASNAAGMSPPSQNIRIVVR